MLADPAQAKLLKRQPDYTAQMAPLCNDLGLHYPKIEYRFAPPRLWRFDFAWVDERVAVEVDGGILRGGRHTSSISGRLRDIEKLNTAASLGWRVLVATTLPHVIFEKKKISKRTGTGSINKLPWMSLADPAFRDCLSAALALAAGKETGK